MTKPNEDLASAFPPGFTHSYILELLYEAPPTFPRWAVDEKIKQRLSNVDAFGKDEVGGPWMYGHLDYVTEYKDGPLPAQTAIVPGEGEPNRELLEKSLQHTYDWPAAREVVGRAHATLSITDLLAQNLAYATRLNLIESVLLGVLEVAPPLAIHWQPSGKIVDPAALQRHLAPGPDHAPLHGAVNVRLFQIAGTEHDVLMDTLGLAALGLPDLQCHFRHLEPGRVAAVLFNYAHYLFANGDLIQDGHTVQGISPDQRWRARHEMSLLEPQRVVLDLNPGPEFAAGNRGN